MPNVQCPHCRGSLEVPAHLAGHAVVCPSCRQQFQVPPAAPVVETFAPSPASSVTNRRSSRHEATTSKLLLGILICNSLLVVMVAAWEIRWQYFHYTVKQNLEEMNQKARAFRVDQDR